MERSKLKFTDNEKLQHSKYILQALIPFLRQFSEEQIQETEMEANIQGIHFNFSIGWVSQFVKDVTLSMHCNESVWAWEIVWYMIIAQKGKKKLWSVFWTKIRVFSYSSVILERIEVTALYLVKVYMSI